MSTDLTLIQKIYDACGYSHTPFIAEPECREYEAGEFKLNGRVVKYRAAKITPTKSGQFVTIWKRNAKGETAPFDQSDEIDFVVISTRKEIHFGQFIFPKQLLLEKGIMSGKGAAGKRGIRVYPPWDEAPNKQAQKTQAWQLEYFLEMTANATDLTRAKRLYSC